MNYDIFVWEMVNFTLVSLFSSIIYMYFEYQDSNKLFKLFIPKNDSIWERAKVMIFISLILMLIEMLFIGVTSNFVFSKLVSIIIMTIANPLIFILYFKFSKWDMMVINVLSAITSALIGLLLSIMILAMPLLSEFITYISILGLIMIFAFYIIATYYQTDDIIFMDPVTRKINLKKDR